MAESIQQERDNPLVSMLRRWQEIEVTSVSNCFEMMHKSENPMVRLLMEIIRHDSLMHDRVQQFLLDMTEQPSVSLTPEELGGIWDLVEEHIALEKEAMELAETISKKCDSFVQRQLLLYLLEDEKKHDLLLAQLEAFKRRVFMEYFPHV